MARAVPCQAKALVDQAGRLAACSASMATASQLIIRMTDVAIRFLVIAEAPSGSPRGRTALAWSDSWPVASRLYLRLRWHPRDLEVGVAVEHVEQGAGV